MSGRVQPPRLKRLKDRSEEQTGASPRPYITILDQTKDWSLFQCEVLGAFPKPEVQFKDGSGNIISAEEPQETQTGGKFYITLQVTVTKTGNYTCVSTQEQIHHQVSSYGYVSLNVVVIEEEEGSDVVLPCSLSTKENIESKRFEWIRDARRNEKKREVFMYDEGVINAKDSSYQHHQFRGRVSHFPEELKRGNASILLRRVRGADAGGYTCTVQRTQPQQTSHIKLLVLSAAPRPSEASNLRWLVCVQLLWSGQLFLSLWE